MKNLFLNTQEEVREIMADNIIPKYYRIVIEASGLVGTSADGGFIDHVYLHEYYYQNNFPANFDEAKQKVRANIRYDFLIQELSENQTISLILDKNNGGATINSPGSAFSFTLVYDRGDYVYTRNELYGVSGHPTQFQEFLYGEDALKRQCARIWTYSIVTQKRMPLNLSAYGWVDEEIEVKTPLTGSLQDKINAAESKITVTKIPGTY